MLQGEIPPLLCPGLKLETITMHEIAFSELSTHYFDGTQFLSKFEI